MTGQRAIIPVYFDYASCLCYLAWRIAARLEAELEVTMRWRPLPLTSQNPAWRPGASITGATRLKIERVAGEVGIALRIPPRWVDSRAALEGAVFAEKCGHASAYHHALFAAAYEDGEDIADRNVLVRCAGAAGLPLGSFMEWIATRRAVSDLAVVRDEARRFGVAGYPTFLLGEFPLTGVQPFETMKLLIARHVARSRTQAQ